MTPQNIETLIEKNDLPNYFVITKKATRADVDILICDLTDDFAIGNIIRTPIQYIGCELDNLLDVYDAVVFDNGNMDLCNDSCDGLEVVISFENYYNPRRGEVKIFDIF